MKKSENLQPLQTHLLQQNCFIRVASLGCDVPVSTPDKYVSIDEVTTEKGIELRETVHDYPITSDYVDSFADSADYHTDVSGAIANSKAGRNLGDIRAMQDISNMDTEQARALYAQLSARFAQAQTQTQTTSNDSVKEGVNNG